MKRFLLIMSLFLVAGLTTLSAQSANPIKIVTNHPDFKVSVTRCVANGKNVVMDLVFRNVGTTDVEELKLDAWWDESQAIDDDGNFYYGGNGAVTVKVANAKDYCRDATFTLLADVPTKVSIMIEGVSPNATAIARLKIVTKASQWGLKNNNTLTIRNVPITRD